MRTIYALLIGINDYPIAKLNGCINDVLAIDAFFDQQSRAPENPFHWNPNFLLAPQSNEVSLLQDRNISHRRPTRQNIIKAFEHFWTANCEEGDCCLLYYSGHGSYLHTTAIPLFKEYEPSGKLQTLVCLSESASSLDVFHLLDKELGFLISECLSKTSAKHRPVSFVSIMDCCHSGTNTRHSALESIRMDHRSEMLAPAQPHGFTRDGNHFYKKFRNGQAGVLPGGINHGRWISLAACQSGEPAYEKRGEDGTSRGVFNHFLLKLLAEGRMTMSYRELIHRIRFAVREETEGKQVPCLDSTLVEDANLPFLQQTAVGQKELEIFFREKPSEEWLLNAGAIHGLQVTTESDALLLQLPNGSKRHVKIVEIRTAESVLDARCFSKEDQTNGRLKARVLSGCFSNTLVGIASAVPHLEKRKLQRVWMNGSFSHLNLTETVSDAPFCIQYEQRSGEEGRWALYRKETPTILFEPEKLLHKFLSNVEKVLRAESIIQLQNPHSSIPSEDIQMQVSTLEGVEFSASTLNDIPDSSYQLHPLDCGDISVAFRKLGAKICQPAIRVKLLHRRPTEHLYWVGALYCDSRFGITDQYLPVQLMGRQYAHFLELNFRRQQQSQIESWRAIPLAIPHDFQLSTQPEEITDHLLIFISDASSPFDLAHLTQLPLHHLESKGAQFTEELVPLAGNWLVKKLAIRIRM
ncbi:MAG: caspase family protein [Bacteroidota bacterium]